VDTYKWAQIKAGRRWGLNSSFFAYFLFIALLFWMLEWENESLILWGIGITGLGFLALIFAAHRIAPKIPRCVNRELNKIIQDGEWYIASYKKELATYEQELAEVSSGKFIKRVWEEVLEEKLSPRITYIEGLYKKAGEIDQVASDQVRLRNPESFRGLAYAMHLLEEVSHSYDEILTTKIPPSVQKELEKAQGSYQQELQNLIVELQESINECERIKNEAESFLR
jgi:hypothetical protein